MFIFILLVLLFSLGYTINDVFTPLEKLRAFWSWVVCLETKNWALFSPFIIGILTLFLFKKQNEISRIALEQNRPSLEIKNTRDYMIPSPCFLEIKNTGESEAENIFICYKKSIEDKWIINTQYKNLAIDMNSNYRVLLEKLENHPPETVFYAVLLIFKNALSGRTYFVAKNINFLTLEKKDAIFDVGYDLLRRDSTLRAKSPISYEELAKIAKNIVKDRYKKLENIQDVEGLLDL